MKKVSLYITDFSKQYVSDAIWQLTLMQKQIK